MRRPKRAGEKSSPDDKQPPGGRAWERVVQFSVARGIPVAPAPGGSPPAKTKRAAKTKSAAKAKPAATAKRKPAAAKKQTTRRR
jgi:hypothetical protein